MEQKKRRIELDILRVITIFVVVLLHVIGPSFFEENNFLSEWWIKFNFIESGIRWCVPIMVMISGALFLDPNKKVECKTIYTKYIFRIVIAFLFWSTIYTIVDLFSYERQLDMIHTILEFLITIILKPHYHLWYIYMILALYMLTPILRKLVSVCTKREMEYILAMMFVFGFCIEFLLSFEKISFYLNSAYSNAHIEFLCSYVFYYVAGYYFSAFKVKKEYIFYILGMLGYIMTVLGTYYLSVHKMKLTVLYDYLYPNTALIAISIWVFFVNQVSKIKCSNRMRDFWEQAANLSFGVYLFHDLVLIGMEKIGITLNEFQTIFSAVIITIVVFLICYFVILGLSKIKICRKYIL